MSKPAHNRTFYPVHFLMYTKASAVKKLHNRIKIKKTVEKSNTVWNPYHQKQMIFRKNYPMKRPTLKW